MFYVYDSYLLFGEYEILIKCQKSSDFYPSRGDKSVKYQINPAGGIKGSNHYELKGYKTHRAEEASEEHSWSAILTTVKAKALVVKDSLQPHGLYPTRFLSLWDSPGKKTEVGVGCYSVLQGLFLTLESNPGLLHCRQILYCLSNQGSPNRKAKSHCSNVLEKLYTLY